MPNHITHPCTFCQKIFTVFIKPCKIAKGHGRFCSRACAGHARLVPLVDRFFQNIGAKQPIMICSKK